MPETLTGAPPPFFIRLFTQVATGLHYLESVGAVFILWLWPSLAPEPRIHQFISTSPIHHKHHKHHHHHRCSSHRTDGDAIASKSDPVSTVMSEASSPTQEELDRIDQALWEEQKRQTQRPDTRLPTARWRVGQRNIEEDGILDSKEDKGQYPIVVSAPELPCY